MSVRAVGGAGELRHKERDESSIDAAATGHGEVVVLVVLVVWVVCQRNVKGWGRKERMTAPNEVEDLKQRPASTIERSELLAV
jgi:hypothetical protein